MFRKIIKNKETGELSMCWRYFIDRKPHYFRDVSLTDEIDISKYDEETIESKVVKLPTPYQLFGIECERGWYPLLQPIINYIDSYNSGKNEEDMIYIMQIKEKYGRLRVYVSSYTKELAELIDKAEDESGKICEICGSEKNVGTTLGWYITICHDCVKQRCVEYNQTLKWNSYDDGKTYLISPDMDDEFVEDVQ